MGQSRHTSDQVLIRSLTTSSVGRGVNPCGLAVTLENYNTAEELLIEKRNTGLGGKGTTAAVCMEGRRVTMRMRNRAAYTWPQIGNKTRHGHNSPVEQKGNQ